MTRSGGLPWTKSEDLDLLAAVEEQRKLFPAGRLIVSWKPVSEAVRTRSAKQCRERWTNHLNPELNAGDWTAHEEQMLWELGNQYPRKWALLASFLPGRSQNKVRTKFESLERKKNGRKMKKKKIKGKKIHQLNDDEFSEFLEDMLQFL